MYCPHCGAENDEGNRFCVNCGSELPRGGKSPQPDRESKGNGARERIGEMVGTTRRARFLTAATIVALAVAVIAFLSLDGEDETSADPYLQSVDQACVAEKERIITLEQEALSQQPPNLQEFASVLVAALAEWRASLEREAPPPDHAREIQAFEAALVATLIETGKLSRMIREEDPAEAISRQAGAVDAATAEVDAVIEDLGLSDCADLQVSPAGKSQS